MPDVVPSDELDAVCAEMDAVANDLLLFLNYLTIHGSTRNRSSSVRRVLFMLAGVKHEVFA